ncbi:hypothetical protein ACEQPO_30645 [Bacillus sp. SL00103]
MIWLHVRFIGPDDVVVMEAPTYPGAIDVFMGRGARIITVPVDHEGMNMKATSKHL